MNNDVSSIIISSWPDAEAQPVAHAYWKFCPKCGGEGTNDHASGGDERCWHCGVEGCGFIECVYIDVADKRED